MKPSSSVSELARDEAARVEAEAAEAAAEAGEDAAGDPDTDSDDAQPDQAAKADAPQPLTPEKADAIVKSLERHKHVVGREVQKRADVMWDDLIPCPLCMEHGPAAGFILPQLPEPDQTLRREAITAALGGASEAAYLEDPQRQTCDACAGLGMLRTGSKVPGQDVLPCSSCNGQGWRQNIAPIVNLVAPQQNGAALANLVAPSPPSPPADQWGRPIGHPHFNIPPAQVTG